MKYLKIFELFTGDAYNYKLIYNQRIHKEYSFTTKDGIEYTVSLLTINKRCKLDFEAKKGEKTYTFATINKYDFIKVFNTIKEIILENKININYILFSARTQNRLNSYLKLCDYFNIKYEIHNSKRKKIPNIVADIRNFN